MKTRMSLLAVVLAASTAAARAETFKIDPGHSTVGFSVRHMMVSKVTGRFQKFQGTLDYEADKPAGWKTQASIEAASINTDVEPRDKHLRSADFFDVEKFPEIAFKSLKTETKDGKTRLLGELTLHGVTRPVALDLEIGGTVKDPMGGIRIGATAKTKINRKDFGLTWNRTLDAGGVAVGDEVEITLEIEGISSKS